MGFYLNKVDKFKLLVAAIFPKAKKMKYLAQILFTTQIFKLYDAFYMEKSEHRLLNENVDPEVFMNASQLITSKGLPCEQYTAATSDGFILGMQRIPRDTPGRYPILLMHGLLGSSDNFLTNLANQSLAYILYNAGYDVWLGNVRGNHYSRQHKCLNPDDLNFWNWTFDEMSMFDEPAMVDRVLQVTGQSKVVYIGHSQGTVVLLQSVMMHDSSFSDKIHSFFALAPAAMVQNMMHWAQMVKSPEGVLKYFDYGSRSLNMQHYGHAAPPSLDFTKFNVPAYLFCGGRDQYVSIRDCMTLYSLLSGKREIFYLDSYTHTDFVWGLDAPSKVYSNILKRLD